MEIVRDLRTLNAICKKYGLACDKEFKYITNSKGISGKIYINNKEYMLKYYDGCFYPYLVATGRKKLADDARIIYNEGVNFYSYSSNKKGTLYFSDNLTPEKVEELQNKYYNIDIMNSYMEFAPEIKNKILVIFK